MELDWPAGFDTWLSRMEKAAADGDRHAGLMADYVTAAMEELGDLDGPPAGDVASLKWVRQSKRHMLWRVSHRFDPRIAVRLICWFPPGSDTVVVVLLGGDKAKIGDVWYDSVASRADPLIDAWKRESGWIPPKRDSE